MNLFNLLKKKPKYEQPVALTEEDKAIDALDLGWVNDHIEVVENYPRIDWDSVTDIVEVEYSQYDKPRFWNNIVKVWLMQLQAIFPGESHIHESENFILLSSEKDSYVNLYLKFLERSYRTTLSSLHGITKENSRGKFIVIITDDVDLYYSYVAYFYPSEGEFSVSSGTFLNDGYGHFVFPHQELTIAESVSAHELTHAMVSHLPIPLWLNEGLAVNMEQIVTGYSQFSLTRDKHQKHQAFWQEKTIQEFWSGKSFSRPDDASELSYQLAQLSVSSLSEDYELFRQFVNEANFADGGEQAAIDNFGGSLGAIVDSYFGEGDWSPKPEKWKGMDS